MVPWYLVAVLVLAYGFYWNSAYELIFLGLLIDTYFGANTMIPYYTLGISITLLSVEWLKPRLLIYNDL